MVHRPIEPEFFAHGESVEAEMEPSAAHAVEVDPCELVLDLTELDPFPNALVGAYLIG